MVWNEQPIDFEERFLALASELGDVVHEGNVIEAEAELT